MAVPGVSRLLSQSELDRLCARHPSPVPRHPSGIEFSNFFSGGWSIVDRDGVRERRHLRRNDRFDVRPDDGRFTEVAGRFGRPGDSRPAARFHPADVRGDGGTGGIDGGSAGRRSRARRHDLARHRESIDEFTAVKKTASVWTPLVSSHRTDYFRMVIFLVIGEPLTSSRYE